MDDLITRRAFLLNDSAEIDDTITSYREAAGDDGDFRNADTFNRTVSFRGDDNGTANQTVTLRGDDNDNDYGNNDIEDDNQVAFDFHREIQIFPEGQVSPYSSSDDEDLEIIMSDPRQLSKLSLRDTPSVAFWQGSRKDPRFKPDQWLSEKPKESFSRDFLQGIGTDRLGNTLRPEMVIIMLAHPNAAGCPANEACHHWELRWDDRPRREPGTIELELICLSRRDRGNFVDLPGKKFHLLDKDHPTPIKCGPCFLYNALKPDFSSLDTTNLDVVLFRMIQPDDGKDDDPVEMVDESDENNLDHPFEKIGGAEVHRYMDRHGRHLATLMYE
ncbi:hypothetical protein FGADI_1975 [Fusarium gaditjirri]|uniref:Uncharacterized protein n=1 Tax=Fusarium gaditjirri TaxID=282569 RepID=A0A8H4TJX0_9HYPO|nr:hypothetical protein FGADI_1975 [Fusarium gaditjirri]